MAKAIVLLSGGLDSTLAVLLLRRQNIEVTAVQFMMYFGCDMSDRASCTTDSTSNASRYGFEVKMCHLADKFTEIVKNPKFGHGKNMNPCIDCRILMLKEAKELMRMSGADFIATGEVLGQRPMSQRKWTFPIIDREAGLAGKVLRPLCAKHMPPTEAELNGLVDREQLMDFRGRSRKPQMALAKEFGLTDYPAPAGGCLLTDPGFSHRFKDLLERNPNPSNKELSLLKLGRLYRLPQGGRAVVGRDERENDIIERLKSDDDYILNVIEYGSPLVLLDGSTSEADVMTAAAICARHTKGKNDPAVDVRIERQGQERVVTVLPASEAEADSMRIQLPEGEQKKSKAAKT